MEVRSPPLFLATLKGQTHPLPSRVKLFHFPLLSLVQCISLLFFLVKATAPRSSWITKVIREWRGEGKEATKSMIKDRAKGGESIGQAKLEATKAKVGESRRHIFLIFFLFF